MQSPNNNTENLLKVMEKTGYPIVQKNGQRIFGPPPGWVGPPPPRGCEVFVGKLPRDVYEDELVPIFSSVGKIYELRLMMDFSGSNRGYAFVTYATRAEAVAAIKKLANYEIRPRRHIGVVESVDNCRLYIGNIPKDVTKEDVFKELSNRVPGMVRVIMYKNCFNRNHNRGYAFAEFVSHRAAAMARRVLVPGCIRMWNRDIMVDWAEPEPEVEDEEMSRVKVLYARNLKIRTTPDTIQAAIEAAIDKKIEKVKKICDYAFIHFYERNDAVHAFKILRNVIIDGSQVEIKWAKPVDRELYRVQKLRRGNAKFNNNLNLSQTLLLYKQHFEKKEYATCPNDEGIGSSYAPDCCSPVQCTPCMQEDFMTAPANLESTCSRYMWACPIYKFHSYFDANGKENYVCALELPHVAGPLFHPPRSLGPLYSVPCMTLQQARVSAAAIALQSLKQHGIDLLQLTDNRVYRPILQSLPRTYIGPWDCTRPAYYPTIPPPVPVTVPTTW
ncbi:probable RNA-binding protein 46 isoform X1 [Pieris rapae]|uniref:probable RNA-binding protein 46 isoform X1 n=1 Tax=Pieris rapae TaxID=64459 RepID=UPI001E27A3DA|nr:probable RNA-binding protein 46 isoform X1 [Pieris rapae]